jgi:hypothetical protein
MARELKLGVHIHADTLVTDIQVTGVDQSLYSYALGEAPLSSAEMQTRMQRLWLEGRLITLDSPYAFNDTKAYKNLIHKVITTVSDLTDRRDRPMAYSIQGVGGDSDCNLQVPLDSTLFETIDLALFGKERPHNCVKLNLSSYSSITHALVCVKKARKSGWPLIICTSETPHLPESSDTFPADFSIGVGAGQVMMGGLQNAGSVDKYNRILEISLEEDVTYAGRGFRIV